MYRFGEWTFDSTKHLNRRAKLEEERRELIKLDEEQKLDRKQAKRLSKLNTNIGAIEKTLEFGNFYMRTGNPRVIYDSMQTEESRRQMEFYLFNNGFFDAETDFEVTKSKKKARITYLITENEPYIVDTFYTRSDDADIYKLLLKNNTGTNIKAKRIYEQSNISKERQRVEDLMKENGYYTFSRSYIEYNVFKDTVDKTVNIEQVIRKPVYADNHQVYTLDSIYFSIDPPSNEFIDRGKNVYKDIILKSMKISILKNYFVPDFSTKGDLYSRQTSSRPKDNWPIWTYSSLSI